MQVETFKKKDRMTNSQKKIFFNLEIRVANDSHKKIECHQTVKQITTWEDACTYLSLVDNRPFWREVWNKKLEVLNN